MSNKSYTLADGSTVTVTATEQGIPFNEGMQALTKAIKARVNVRDGSSGSGGASKQIATLTSSTGKYLNPNANYTFTYNGDAVLKTTLGTMSGTTLSLSSSDAGKGVVYAEETNNYSAAVYPFVITNDPI